MAAVISVAQLASLLRKGERQGAGLVWRDEQGNLCLGRAFRRPEYRIDLDREALVPMELSTVAHAENLPSQQGRPPPQASYAGAASVRQRATGNFLLTLDGERFHVRSLKELLVTALSGIEHRRPGTLDNLAQEKARTKRIVSRSREELYENPKLMKYAVMLDGKWWVGTNNSWPEAEKFIRRAGFLGGIHVDIQRLP